MKLKFKTQAYQLAAVQAVVDCFKGQLPATVAAMKYTLDPGRSSTPMQMVLDTDSSGNAFKNADVALTCALRAGSAPRHLRPARTMSSPPMQSSTPRSASSNGRRRRTFRPS